MRFLRTRRSERLRSAMGMRPSAAVVVVDLPLAVLSMTLSTFLARYSEAGALVGAYSKNFSGALEDEVDLAEAALSADLT